MLSHANLLVSAYGLGACGVSDAAVPVRYLHVAPMFHLADLAGSIGTMLLGGIHVTVPSFAPVPVMDAIETHAVTHTVLIPIMIQALADHPELAGRDLTALRRVVYGGSPIAQARRSRAGRPGPRRERLLHRGGERSRHPSRGGQLRGDRAPGRGVGERVHAVLVLHDGAAATGAEIRGHARATIAGYKVPRTVEFVGELPSTPTGRVLKRELRSRTTGGG